MSDDDHNGSVATISHQDITGHSVATVSHQEITVGSVATIDHQDITGDTAPNTEQHQNYKISPDVKYNIDDPHGVIIISPNSPPIITQEKLVPKKKPKDFVVTSCGVILLCNFIFGLLGYHYGCKYTSIYYIL